MLDLSGAQAAVEDYFMPHTLTTVAKPVRSSVCGLRTTSQTVQRSVNGRDQVVSVCLLSLPVDTAISLAPDEQIRIGGRTYAVIGPRVGNLSLATKYEVYEWR